MSLRAIILLLGIATLAGAQAPARATVATHYFYWYHWPSEHFGEPGAPGPEGHCRHFVEPAKVSYRSVDWHAQNFAAMGGCGIDVALPVYWGAPGAYDRPNLAFARAGLQPMVDALDLLAAARTPAPRLGLFYDTSTLANDVRGAAPAHGKADLTTAAGRELFCSTVTDYFAAIPQRHWARHRGGALAVLYASGFAAKWDARLGTAVRAAFAQRFDGDQLCLVADASWGDIGQDLTTSWGAALWGAQLHPAVAQIGAGYDDRAVPGRNTPVREREDGAFYAASWQRALRHAPELVLLETWNEMHEGTELCATREGGAQYLDATRAWVQRLRTGADPGAPIALRWTAPRPQPDLAWGREASGAPAVSVDYGGKDAVRSGLREIAWADGPCLLRDGALRAGTAADGLGSYLYFQVSDHFAFDVDARFELEVVHAAATPLGVEFDAAAGQGALDGSY
ncbi:MAG TPA: hypothetical protein VK348_06970, partial [Planctomycetota bacterium]|nr:hypothetical protein [Planctomycetota bacterium]